MLAIDAAMIAVSDAVNLALTACLRPGDLPCEACAGRGRMPGDPDLCPVCRGWGAADPDPDDLEDFPSAALCTVCGDAGDLDDPMLTDRDGSPVHRAHLATARQRYQWALIAYMSREAS